MNPEQASLMAAYNRWMNQRLYAVCAELSDAQRKQDRKAFFGSIHGTLNHLLLADRVWLGRFRQQPFAARALDQELYSDFDELRAERELTDMGIESWVAGLSEDQLASELHYTSLANPAPRSYRLWVAVTHFFNHQTHHRGQLTTLLSQAGKDFGVTDLLMLPELAAASATPSG